jgi:hypothetical protein
LQASKSGIKVYVNLLDAGLYKSKDITSNINEPNFSPDLQFLKVITNPQNSDQITFLFSTEKNNNVELKIFDFIGNIIYSNIFNNLNIGSNQITLDNVNLLSGNYFVVLSDGINIISSKFVIIK